VDHFSNSVPRREKALGETTGDDRRYGQRAVGLKYVLYGRCLQAIQRDALDN